MGSVDVENRSIRSYVLRIGRITPSQKKALSELTPRYGIDLEKDTLAVLYPAGTRLVLEIGFGMGESLVKMAKGEPDTQFIGVEVHLPGVGQCMAQCDDESITNLKVVNRDVNDVIDHWLADESLDRVQIFFPDPWPKVRHQKRRIIQSEFIARLVPKLKKGGLICLATDWEEYAQWMLEVMEANVDIHNVNGPNNFAPSAIHRVQTKFERRGLKLSHQIFDLVYQKK